MNTADAEFAADVLQQAGILELIPAIFPLESPTLERL